MKFIWPNLLWLLLLLPLLVFLYRWLLARKRRSTVRLASFQLQAETGRGTAGGSEGAVSIDGVAERIQRGAGARIAFDTPLATIPSQARIGGRSAPPSR